MIPGTAFMLFACAGVTAANVSPAKPISPSHDSAKENANLIFNAIHSAGRQWGSSYYHNGFGFFPAVMPIGTLMYHGSHTNQTPPGPEWLAFEIEHAENFGKSFRGGGHGRRPPPLRPPGPPGKGKGPGVKPKPGNGREELRRRDEDDTKTYRGYLHVYQANRDLNLLVLDGMSAGKTTMGTLDSQDLLLRENTTKHNAPGHFDEWPRALDLCDIVTEWGYDGVVRMEVGFEVIHCDFTKGLELVSMTRTIMPEDKVGDEEMEGFEFVRALAERYDGLGGDRLRIDFSSMVSGLFFPINISSIDADRPDLFRLGAASLGELKDVKSHLEKVATGPRRFTVNWQGVVDLIISRFSKRLASLASAELPWKYFADQIESVTATWFDAPPLPEDVSLAEMNRTADAIDRCQRHFLRPAVVSQSRWSFEDDLIFTSIDSVMGTICHDLFLIRNILLDASHSQPSHSEPNHRDGINKDNDDDLREAVKTSRALIQAMMKKLGWTCWLQTQPCPVDQVMFIAMWPIGAEEDHWNPGCRSIDQIRQTSNSYWKMSWGPPKRRPEEM